MTRLSRMTVAWGCGACLACIQPPELQFARQLERAASWTAAVDFAATPPVRDGAPVAYRGDLDRRAAEDLTRIANSLGGIDVDAPRRDRAADACRRLAALLTGDPLRAPRRDEVRSAGDDIRRFAAAARGTAH